MRFFFVFFAMQEEGLAKTKESVAAEMPEFDAAEESAAGRPARCGRKSGSAAPPPPTVPLTRVLRRLRARNRVYMLFGW